MTTTSSGIPTMYKRVRFRSRLEARWAAFFDRLGWPWEYEPIDLSGYIPDFILPFEKASLLVEVKPVIKLDELGVTEWCSKIECSGWEGEALLVGAAIDCTRPARLGMLGEVFDGSLIFAPAMLFTCLSCGGLSFRHDHLSWCCRRCGEGHGDNSHIGELDDHELLLLERSWAESGNRVQWRPS